MNFWQNKTLDQLEHDEWEALCDGCGKCCLHKLQDEDDDAIYFTDIACAQLDAKRCQCKDYKGRGKIEICLNIRHMSRENFTWLPPTCAYRLLDEGKPLPEWHPLVAGSKKEMHRLGQSVKNRVVSEDHVHPDQWQERIIEWV